MPRNRFDDYSRTARSRNLADRASRALRQAHESARRAYEKGETVSRAYNWLHLFNHPSPASAERSRERWNREVGTRIGAAAASAGDIGPQLVSAMQGGILLVSEVGAGEHSTPPAGRAWGNDGNGHGHGQSGPGGRGAVPEYRGDEPQTAPDTGPEAGAKAPPATPDAPAPDPELPYGNSELFWDFVL